MFRSNESLPNAGICYITKEQYKLLRTAFCSLWLSCHDVRLVSLTCDSYMTSYLLSSILTILLTCPIVVLRHFHVEYLDCLFLYFPGPA